MSKAARLERFVRDFGHLIDAPPPGGESALLAHGRPLLADLLEHDDWLPEACAQPGEPHYRQYPLHVDPQQRFSVVSFVWGPGQRTPVHDHTVWALIGMLRGAERAERFATGAAGEPMRPLGVETMHPGDVDAVSPTLGDIHRVSNGFDDRVSISIHVYGGDIGRISRHVYDPETSMTRDFVSGYSVPATLPQPQGAHS